MRKIIEWLKDPHGWALAPLYIVTAAAIAASVVCAVVDLGALEPLAYVFYAFAAILLGYSVYTIVRIAPRIKQAGKSALMKNAFTGRLVEQYGFRTLVFAVFSFTLSTANAVLNGAIGIINLSAWYGALGAYYLLLALMRGGVLLYHRKKKKFAAVETEEQIKRREIKRYRLCGLGLMLLPLALSAIILETVVSDRAFVRAGLMIYVAAAYTFYKIILAVFNFVKVRRRSDDMTVQAVRNVNLADALVSVLALQTAMFHEFSPTENFGYANAATGSVVCLLTVALGIYMFVHATLLLKRPLPVPADSAEEQIGE